MLWWKMGNEEGGKEVSRKVKGGKQNSFISGKIQPSGLGSGDKTTIGSNAILAGN